jgi:HEAT repeat protein
MRDARAVDALIRALEDSEMWVRAQAATSLGKIGDARATEALRRALEDVGTSAEPDIDERMADKLTYPVREAAKKALDRMAYSNRNLLASRREHRLP